ncbi:hypothetical protein [Scytonema sp. NUACC26]
MKSTHCMIIDGQDARPTRAISARHSLEIQSYTSLNKEYNR